MSFVSRGMNSGSPRSLMARRFSVRITNGTTFSLRIDPAAMNSSRSSSAMSRWKPAVLPWCGVAESSSRYGAASARALPRR